ncbi:MAG: gamma-glutamylcyclotransferase family protein [Moorellaceae bacterium]
MKKLRSQRRVNHTPERAEGENISSGNNRIIPVFVYGTLTSMNSRYLRRIGAVGPYTAILHGYSLYQVAPSYPGLCPGEGGKVRGEVYYVAEEDLRKLDRYEDVPREYERKKVEVELADGRKIQAWCYVWNGPPQGRQIPWEEMPWKKA